jgi:hypothetical protein
VGWGTFPLVNGNFNINEGKFKIPMIHGKVDYDIDAFTMIEHKYRRNIDEWLCNLYIDIKKIELNDFKEYETNIIFSTKK